MTIAVLRLHSQGVSIHAPRTGRDCKAMRPYKT